MLPLISGSAFTVKTRAFLNPSNKKNYFMLAVVPSETNHANEAFHSLSTCAKGRKMLF